jgi:hypothetical protein
MARERHDAAGLVAHMVELEDADVTLAAVDALEPARTPTAYRTLRSCVAARSISH